MKRPTRNDVARLAEVSGWTVSQVLNGRSDVSITEATRARIHAAAEELGYRPNHTARALATGNTHIVSLWAGRLSPFYALVLTHLRREAHGHGYRILISDIEESASPLASLGPVDGVIAVEHAEWAHNYLDQVNHMRMPFVSIGAYYLADTDYVGVDLNGGVRDAMDHLVATGCRRIAYACTGGDASGDEPRAVSYRSHRLGAGQPVEFIDTCGSRAGARVGVREFVAAHGRPDAILCHNDEQATGVYRGLRDLGLNVPDEVSLVGCDGIEEAEYLDRPLTTIVQPIEEMCALGWAYLSARMRNPALPPQHAVLRPRLSLRSSTRDVAV